jgi:hypothetical protein
MLTCKMATNLLGLAAGVSILLTLSYQVFTGGLQGWVIRAAITMIVISLVISDEIEDNFRKWIVFFIFLIWTPTFYLFNIIAISVSLSISFFAFLWLLGLLAKFKLIKDIPVVPNNSIVGFIDPFIPLKGDAHFRMLDIANKFGKLVQFTFLGHHIVMINDGSLAKQALLGVTGKGFFHRRDPKVEHKNVINLDTGPEWQIRRNILKRPFTHSNLRKFKNIITSAGERVCAKLDQAAESGQPVEIDMIFGQMAIDVICEVGFDFKLGALNDPSKFQVIGSLCNYA